MWVISVAPPARAAANATNLAHGPPVKWKRFTPTKTRPSEARNTNSASKELSVRAEDSGEVMIKR
jgi:hypothetical protein